jgi:hypothetical protein
MRAFFLGLTVLAVLAAGTAGRAAAAAPQLTFWV